MATSEQKPPIRPAASLPATEQAAAEAVCEVPVEDRESLISRLAVEHALFEEVLRQMPVGVLVVDARTGTFVLGNPHAESITGYRVEPGRPLLDAHPFEAFHADGRAYLQEEWPAARALLHHETVREEEMQFLHRDGTRATMRVSAAPVRNAHGEVIAAVTTFYDLTERKLAEQRLSFLAEASRILAESLEYEETLKSLAHIVVPTLADWCAIHMLDDAGNPQCLEVVHSDARKVEQARALRQRYPVDMEAPYGIGHVLRSGKPEFVAEITDALLHSMVKDPERLEVLRALGFRSYIAVPLIARGRVLGALALVHAESLRKYTENDFRFARDLAGRAAISVDNALLFRAAQEELLTREVLSTQLQAKTRSLEALNSINSSIAAELDLKQLVQKVTDAATDLSGAQFGAFFYNVISESGEAYTLYTISGVPREAFASFPMPRNTKIFAPTFEGRGVVRYFDVMQHPDYAQNPPYNGMPKGHLPVRSYLAAPVVSKSGEVIGGLFFGHAEPGRFDDEAERVVSDIAKQAAIAVDNARLYAAAQKEIRERQQAEEALRASEERLRFTLEAAKVGTWNWDMRSNSLEWSDNLIEIHNLDPLTFGGTFSDFQQDIHPDDRPQVEQKIQKAIAEGGAYHVEYRLNKSDGSLAWVEGKGRVIYDSSQQPAAMAGICMDVTERKLGEMRFRAAVESSPSAVVMVDPEGRIALVNSQTECLFGYQRDELLGQSVEMLVPHRFRHHHPAYRSSFYSQPQARPMGSGRDLFGLRKDGTEFPVEIGLNPIQMVDGVYVLSAILDITERKRAEAALTQVNEEMRQKNAELEQFVYTVSHDLKSPLVTANGFIGLLREDIEAKRFGEVEDSFRRLERATLRMSELIDDLLELSRIGRIERQAKVVETGQVLQEMVEELSDRVRSVQAEVEIETSLPRLFADPVRIAELFENLLTNAVKYGCPNPGMKIYAGAIRKGESCRIYIRDDGPGVAPEYHEKIFGLFQRLESGGEGTGVGLTIVSRIMQLMGGHVWVQSAPGAGATFWLEFPPAVIRP